MEYLGVVMELKDNKAFIMTNSCEVVCIRKQPGMYEGMELVFDRSEKINIANSVVKYSAVIGSAAAVFIAIVFYVNLIFSNQIYAYVGIDMNTNLELAVDKNNRVIDIRTNDENQKVLIEDLNYKSKPLESVLVDMVENFGEKGMIDSHTDNKVLITACLQDKYDRQAEKEMFKNLENSYSKIKDELQSRNIQSYFMEVKSEDRKFAADNNISTGRYSIYKKSKEQGIDIDIEKLKHNQINEILEKVVVDDELVDVNEGTSDKINHNTPVKQETEKSNDTEKGSDFNEEDIDLSLGGINDIDIIQSIEAANFETQKVIREIQQKVKDDIKYEKDKANEVISKIEMDKSISDDKRTMLIKQIEIELIKKIEEIKRIGNEKAQAELNKLEQKTKDLLNRIN